LQHLACFCSDPKFLKRVALRWFLFLNGITDHQTAGLVAEKLAAAILTPTTLTLTGVGEHQIVHIGVSIGISLYPDHGSDLETLLSRADSAMYVAKVREIPYSIYRDEDLD